jgi:hypothetical protein
MLNQIMKHLDEVFPLSKSPITQERWDTARPIFTEYIEEFALKLIEQIAFDKLRKRLTSESAPEIISSSQPIGMISEFRFRPKNTYYKLNSTLPIPRPENKSGVDATGIELNLALYAWYLRPSEFYVTFQVWGENERRNFGNLLQDHRYLIKKLIEIPSIKFNTSYVFDNLEASPSAKTPKKLELYFENEDDENYFCLESVFGATSNEQEILQVLTNLAILYDAAMGYCIKRKNRERLYEYHIL